MVNKETKRGGRGVMLKEMSKVMLNRLHFLKSDDNIFSPGSWWGGFVAITDSPSWNCFCPRMSPSTKWRDTIVPSHTFTVYTVKPFLTSISALDFLEQAVKIVTKAFVSGFSFTLHSIDILYFMLINIEIKMK